MMVMAKMNMMIVRLMAVLVEVMTMIIMAAIAASDSMESFTGKQRRPQNRCRYEVDSRGLGQQGQDR